MLYFIDIYGTYRIQVMESDGRYTREKKGTRKTSKQNKKRIYITHKHMRKSNTVDTLFSSVATAASSAFLY